MKIIISIIVIVILLFLLLLLILSNYTTETFITKKDLDNIKNYSGKITDTYDTIDNPIEDNLLPINPDDKIKLNEYEIIDIYKNIVERPPNIEEMKKHAYYSNNELKEILYNSPEYDKLIKTQNNNVNNGIEGAIAKRNIINRIMEMYSKIYKDDLPIKMMTPLRDCFIHLQLNEYLFLAMLESLNYKKFQVDVLSTYVLTKKILLKLFNKHFNVLELKLIAQDKINENSINKISIKDEIETIKKNLFSTSTSTENSATTIDILNTIKDSFPIVYDELIKSMSADTESSATSSTTPKTDIDILNEYLTSVEKYQNKNNTLEQPSQSYQIPSLEQPSQSYQIPSQQPSQSYQIPSLEQPSQSYQIPSQQPSQSYQIPKELYQNRDIIEKMEIDKSLKKKLDKLPDDTELYVRVYNPMKHNNNYQLPDGYKAPICTSLGQKQLAQPIFTESKLLFQGTDLKTAFTETQVGSIMPKFIYKEYKDVKIN